MNHPRVVFFLRQNRKREMLHRINIKTSGLLQMELLLCDLDLYIINYFTFKYPQGLNNDLNLYYAALHSILYFLNTTLNLYFLRL